MANSSRGVSPKGGKQGQKAASKASGATRRLGDKGNFGTAQRSSQPATKILNDRGNAAPPFPGTSMPDGDKPAHRSSQGR